MSITHFKHVKVTGLKTVVPENFIDIDSELEYFDNNQKKLDRAKKMIGYGRRYIADDLTTVTDMAVDAAQKLLNEMAVGKDSIDALIFVNQKPDYKEPSDACIAHGRLNLKKNTIALSINLGCSGYLYGLWLAHTFLELGVMKKCLLLVGDIPTRVVDTRNRKSAQLFSDSASATLIEYSEEEILSSFILGTDGSCWDKLIVPFGGVKLPVMEDIVDLTVQDKAGNVWTHNQSIMQGEDVFNFTLEVAPTLIKETLSEMSWEADDVDLYAIHQANKQILENIIDMAEIPPSKTPLDTFTKYANCSTNSVVTVVSDQSADVKLSKVVLCAFGVGLSWGSAGMDFSHLYNGGISTYYPPEHFQTREEQIQFWIKQFIGE